MVSRSANAITFNLIFSSTQSNKFDLKKKSRNKKKARTN